MTSAQCYCQSIDSDSKKPSELCAKLMKTTPVVAIEDPVVQKPFATSCQGDGGHSNGGINDLEPMCESARISLHPCTLAIPVTPRRVTISSNDVRAIQGRMPPTPDQTPSRGIKRSFSGAVAEGSTSAKARKLFGTKSERSPSSSPFRRNSVPKFSILYERQQCKSPVVSAIELKRASEAVLKQVDWEAVEEEVASNRGAAMYRKLIRDILQERIDSLGDLETGE